MSGPRYVIVRISDPEATKVRAQVLGSAGYVCEEHDIPVSSDDTLEADMNLAIEALVEAARNRIDDPVRDRGAYVRIGTAARLSARFSLDEGSET